MRRRWSFETKRQILKGGIDADDRRTDHGGQDRHDHDRCTRSRH
jgi:hypothetical protein